MSDLLIVDCPLTSPSEDLRQLAADLMRERDSLRTQLTEQAKEIERLRAKLDNTESSLRLYKGDSTGMLRDENDKLHSLVRQAADYIEASTYPDDEHPESARLRRRALEAAKGTP